MKSEKKKLDIKSIQKNPSNPRVIKDQKFQKLIQSIKDFPEMLEMRPVVVNEDMVILGGNMRYEAAKALGLTEIPVIIAKGLSEQQQKEFVIKDNASFGEWDWDLLANDFGEAPLTDWGIDIWQPDYEPQLNPSKATGSVTDRDIDNAENAKDHLPQATGSVVTICPHCGEEFEVQIN